MKTQIIQLDEQDDVISARDKMGWIQTGRIILVWPDRGHILDRRLDLVLLQRHSASLGAKLALVTQDSEVRFNAELLGIPTFELLHQAQSERWRMRRRRKPRHHQSSPRSDPESLRQQKPLHSKSWLDTPIARLGFFTFSILALMTLVAFLLPSAEVTLTPVLETQETILTVSANPSISNINLTGELPTYTMTVTVEGRDSITSTGTVQVPIEPAIGGVQFTNLTDHAVVIPEGTVVSTLGSNPVRFATTKEGKVLAGPGKQVILPMTALTLGSKGNLPPDSIQAIEGPLGLNLTVTNPMSMHSGGDSTAPGPNPNDRARLYNRLFASLRKTAKDEIQANLSTGDIVLPHSFELTRVVEKTYTPSGEYAAEHLDLTLRVEFEALVVSENDIKALVTPILDADIPYGYSQVPDSLIITHIEEPQIGSENISQWQIQAKRTIQAYISEEEVFNSTIGLTTAQASDNMASTLPVKGAPRIELIPSWWPRLPFLSFRINIITINEH
jgi:hypothetical protein